MSFSAIYDILKCDAMFECSVILSAVKTDAKHNTMHTAVPRKIAALRRAAGATGAVAISFNYTRYCIKRSAVLLYLVSISLNATAPVYTDLAVCSQCDAVFRKENL